MRGELIQALLCTVCPAAQRNGGGPGWAEGSELRAPAGAVVSETDGAGPWPRVRKWGTLC